MPTPQLTGVSRFYETTAFADGVVITKDFSIDPATQGEVIFDVEFLGFLTDILDDPSIQSNFPTSDEMTSMLNIVHLGDGRYRLTFDSGQHNFDYLNAIDIIGARFNITAVNSFGGEVQQTLGMTIQGINEGIVGPQTVTEASNAVLSGRAPPQQVFFDSNWQSSTGSSIAQSVTLTLQDWADSFKIYAYQSAVDSIDTRWDYERREGRTPLQDGEIGNGFSASFDGDEVTLFRTDGGSFDANDLIKNLFVWTDRQEHSWDYGYEVRFFQELVTEGTLSDDRRSFFGGPNPPNATPKVVLKSIVDLGGTESFINDVCTLTYAATNQQSVIVIDTQNNDRFDPWYGLIANYAGPSYIAHYTNHIETTVEYKATGFNWGHHLGTHVYEIEGKYGLSLIHI